jgi:hypothetical protein
MAEFSISFVLQLTEIFVLYSKDTKQDALHNELAYHAIEFKCSLIACMVRFPLLDMLVCNTYDQRKHTLQLIFIKGR